jgi:orotate phosphoribosyltransferase
MDILKKQFASKLLQIKAIKLQPNNPFTWASGWKSPFYCDNRKTLSYPDLRSYVKLELRCPTSSCRSCRPAIRKAMALL